MQGTHAYLRLVEYLHLRSVAVWRFWIGGWLMVACIVHIFSSVSNAQSVHDLIEQLASPNRAPTVVHGKRDEVRFVYPPDYDQKAQERVQRAWDVLLARGEEAMSQIVEHVDDARYSYTVGERFGGGNRSVGYVCGVILQNAIEVYEQFVPYESEVGTPVKPHFVFGIGTPAVWSQRC